MDDQTGRQTSGSARLRADRPFRGIGSPEPWPLQLRDLTVVSFSVVFDAGVPVRHFPAALRPARPASGGFEFVVGHWGQAWPPIAMATIWADLDPPHGDAAAPRFILSRLTSRQSADDPLARVAITIRDEAQGLHLELRCGQRLVITAALAPTGAALPAAGVSRYVDPDHGGHVVPWSADLVDARPLSLQVLDRGLVDLQPQEVFAASLAVRAAMTLGWHDGAG